MKLLTRFITWITHLWQRWRGAYIWRGELSTKRVVTVMMKKSPWRCQETLWTDPPLSTLTADEQAEFWQLPAQKIATNIALVRRARKAKPQPIDPLIPTIDELRTALCGNGVIPRRPVEPRGTRTVPPALRLVTQQEFKTFLTAYPKTLTAHLVTVGDPPVLHYCDETRGRYPGTIVASVLKHWDVVTHESFESHWRILA